MATCELTLKSETETQQFAVTLSAFLTAGHCILLQGDIGAGKTFFARSLIQHILGTTEEVPSPTFTLVQTYEAPDFDIWHCDLYRLQNSQHTDELGLEDAFETALCLIEWPDRLGASVPDDALTLSFRVDQNDESRQVTMAGPREKWGELMDHFHGS